MPADADVKAALDEMADHPEITLSRRDILSFILVEPTKRSEEIQTLLKLEEIGQTRSALNSAQNRLQADQRLAAARVQSSREALRRHLQVSSFQAADVLAAVNQRREVLGLSTIATLTADTKVDQGVSEAARAPEFNKRSALRDITALTDASHAFPSLGKAHAADILAGISQLEADSSLLGALQRRSLIEKGLDLLDGPECPLCGHPWDDEQHLREHLRAKLAKSEEAARLQEALLNAGIELGREEVRLLGLVGPVIKIAELQGDRGFADLLVAWKFNLENLKSRLISLDGLIGLKDRLTLSWLEVPEAFSEGLAGLTRRVEAIPDQTATFDAQTFLATAQVRLGDYREAMRENQAAEVASRSAKTAYDAYCRVMEDELNALYDEVQEDFSAFYRAINEDEEATFTARLTPSEGRLDLSVNFYERGLFPPGAYHSEGHQDGMGVCLYLALMKRLFGTPRRSRRGC